MTVPTALKNAPAATGASSAAKIRSDYSDSTGEHDPRLYRPTALAETIPSLDAIGPAECARFAEQGYLSIEKAFDAAEVREALFAVSDLIAGKNPAFEGRMVENKAKARLAEMSEAERYDAIRKLSGFCKHDARLDALCRHPKLLAVLRKLQGGEPECFQDMALLKPPRIGREKPWHQDNAYFKYAPGATVVGVWIALDEAGVENGCMHILPGGHRAGPRIHFKRRDWQLCDTEMLGVPCTAVPLPPGGCLLFNGLLPHGTPTNHSGKRRRALQFHYAPAGALKISEEERLALFGSEGKDVEC